MSRILARELPPRALRYAVLNQVNRWLKTGDNRFEFERMYLESSDPWELRSSAYELTKYQRTLDRIVSKRTSAERVLEVGCSIGSFTRRLSANFAQVVAIDFSDEAIAKAKDHCRDSSNIRFIRSNLQSLELDASFDVIVCAEILYYIANRHAPAVCTQLQRYLAPNGIIAMVGGSEGPSDFWESALQQNFTPILKEHVPDNIRPYNIIIFQRP